MKKRILALLIVLSMLLTTACGYRTEIKLKSAKDYTAKTYVCYTKSELKEYDLSTKDAEKKITVGGKTYYCINGEDEDDPAGADEDALDGMLFTSGKFELPLSTIGEDSDTLDNLETFLDGMDFWQYKITFPKKVLKANGTICKDGYSVIFNLKKSLTDVKKGGRMYAAFTNTAMTAKKITIEGVTDGKTYSTTRTIKVSSSGVIKSLTLNGREVDGNTFKVKKSGTYTVKVSLLSGSSKTVKFKIKK